MTSSIVSSAKITIEGDLTAFASSAETQIRDVMSNLSTSVEAGSESVASKFGQVGASGGEAFTNSVNESVGRASAALADSAAAGSSGAIDGYRSVGAEAGSAFTTATGEAIDGSVIGTSAADSGAAVAEAVGTAYAVAGDDAGTAYNDALQTAIDTGGADVQDAADEQANAVGEAVTGTMEEAGTGGGEALTAKVREGIGGLAAKAAPVIEAEAAKTGAEAGVRLGEAGHKAGEKFGEGITESFKGLASSLGPAIGILGAGELVKSSLEAGDQLEGANIRIENVFGDSADTIKKWAGGVSGSLRQSTVDAETYAGQIGAYLSGLGVGKEQAAGLAEQVDTLAQNMAAFNNADPAATQAALTSALRGRTTALKQYGVTLTPAQVNQEALTHASEMGTLAMKNGVPVLNTQQKALATLYAVMDATKGQQGALASTSDTLKAKQQETTAEFSNMRAELGTALMPILASVFGFLNTDAIPALVSTGHWISQNGEWIKPLALGLGGLLLVYKGMAAATSIWRSASAGMTAVLQLLGISSAEAATGEEALAAATVETDEAMDANPIGLIVTALAALAMGLYYAYTHSKTFRDIVDAIGRALKTAYNDVLRPVANFFMNNWRTALLVAGLVFLPFVALPLLVYKYWGAITGWFSRMWGDVEDVFTSTISDVVGFVKKWWPVILIIMSGGLLTLPVLIFKYWSQIIGFVTRIWNDVIGFLKTVPGKIISYFATAGSFLLGAGAKIMQGLLNGMRSLLGGLGDFVAGIEDHVLDWLGDAGSWLLDIGYNIIQGIIHGIENGIGQLKNVVTGLGGDIKGWASDALSIFSPSRVMADEVGHYIPAGIAVGIQENESVVQYATEHAASLAVDVGGTMNVAAGGIDGALNRQPVPMANRPAEKATTSGETGMLQQLNTLTAAVMRLANRPIVLKTDNRTIAKSANDGNNVLARVA